MKQKLQGIIEELFQPFTDLWNLGQRYSEKFSQLFGLITKFKSAYNKLKLG